MTRTPKDAHAIHAAKIGNGGLAQQVTKAAASRRKNAKPGEGAHPNPGQKHRAMSNADVWADGYRASPQPDSRPAQVHNRITTEGGVFGALAVGAGEAPEEPATTGTSIFDPVLCELVYRWFCPPGGLVLDPFAGGSVRGIVASRLGRAYVGLDLREEQVRANEAQLAIAGEPKPRWLIGDSADIVERAAEIGDNADLLFSCPPYGDLEVYSDDPADLSTMEPGQFDELYESIIVQSCKLLAADRFAVFVVGDYRDRDGLYRNLPGKTVAAFELAGLRLYNEAILVTAVGSLPVRARKQFVASRKLGKTHQNLLVFVKGDPVAAAQAVGPVQFGEFAVDVEKPAQPEGGENRQAAASGSPAAPPETASVGLIRVPATPLGGEI